MAARPFVPVQLQAWALPAIAPLPASAAGAAPGFAGSIEEPARVCPRAQLPAFAGAAPVVVALALAVAGEPVQAREQQPAGVEVVWMVQERTRAPEMFVQELLPGGQPYRAELAHALLWWLRRVCCREARAEALEAQPALSCKVPGP